MVSEGLAHYCSVSKVAQNTVVAGTCGKEQLVTPWLISKWRQDVGRDPVHGPKDILQVPTSSMGHTPISPPPINAIL